MSLDFFKLYSLCRQGSKYFYRHNFFLGRNDANQIFSKEQFLLNSPYRVARNVHSSNNNHYRLQSNDNDGAFFNEDTLLINEVFYNCGGIIE
jgi:hypothetical protein